MLSAALAFSTLLSIVPFLAVTLAVIKASVGLEFLGPKVAQLVLGLLHETTGPEASEMLRKLLRRMGRSSWGLTSTLVLLLTSLKLFADMEQAVNRIWGLKGERPWWKRLLLLMSFLILVPFGLAIYAGLRSAQILKPVFALVDSMGLVLVCFVFLFTLNKFMPAVRVRVLTALLATFFSTLGILILQGSFSWLTKAVFHYSKIYGSLAAIPIFCLWVLIGWQIVLTGVAVGAGMQGRGPKGKAF